MTEAIFNVDATALFYGRPQPSMGKLLLELNTRLSGQTGCHMTFSDLSHSDWWLLACEKFHIMITFAEHPMAPEKLRPSATSPVTTLRRFDYDQVANSHRAHLCIEVGDGSAPLPPEARIIMQEFGSASACDTDLKLKVLHWTSQFIARHEGFLALHFGPSDRLFAPEELREVEKLDLPTPLLMHPVPSLPVVGPSGADGYALRMKSPDHLKGPAIELEGIPVSVPLATSVSLLNTLWNVRAKGKLSLSHGKIFKPNPKISLYVREVLPDEEAPNGRMILSFWKDCGHDLPAPQAQLVAVQEVQKPVQVDPTPAPTPVTNTDPTPDMPEATFAPRRVTRKTKPSVRPVRDDSSEEAQPQTHSKTRRGLSAWVAARVARIPMETRVKIAGFALLFGLQFAWNPYSHFTGGIHTQTHAEPSHAQVVQPRNVAERFAALMN